MVRAEGVIGMVIMFLILITIMPYFAIVLTTSYGATGVYGSLFMFIALAMATYGFYKKAVKD